MDLSSKFGEWVSKPPPGEEVVISGVSGRYPESNNIREFQENLFNKKDMVTDDDRRWKLDHPEVPQRNGKVYNINKLDAGFFGLHYRQADIMDPMTRKILECAIEAILDAGIHPEELAGTKTAVCIGACYADMETDTLVDITKPQSFGITGYLRSFMAHRISYFLKLKSSSCTIDTACSSSANALELAFKSIRTGKCDNAIVGGANLLLHPSLTRQFYRLGVLSSDGTCKVFDQKADGYVRGETIACVFLQKAKEARRIYAKIIHTKVNGDGFKHSGITFPSTQMQKELMEDTLKESGIDASELSFMEAHGTGTEVGDPQEVEAIDSAIAKKRNQPLLIGSVKCSVGHTEPASGLNSLSKVLIALETGYIPPNIHLETIKIGLIGFEEGRLIPVTELTELDKDDAIIGINNFGFGGNNCHLLVQRFKKIKINQGQPKDDLPRLVCVSGRTENAVLTLLEDINSKPLDHEYIGLLHQVFKKNMTGHCYRGFTIVSKTAVSKTDYKLNTNKNPLYIIFGKLEKTYKVLGQYLMKFKCFRSIIKMVNEVLDHELNINEWESKNRSEADYDILGSFAVQIGVVEVLKLLEIEPNAVHGDSYGQLITGYFYNDITLTEAIHALCLQMETPSAVKEINIETLLADTVVIAKKSRQRKDSFALESLKSKSQKSLVLNVSDNVYANNGHLVFVKNNDVIFLEVLGRLYTEGHNLQLHKLYPEVQFPVSRGTPSISPSILWNYEKNWFTYKFGDSLAANITQQEFNLSVALYEKQKFLLGHFIDGRNLIPATQYLQLVRKTCESCFREEDLHNVPLVFENCRFLKAVTLPKSGVVKLLVSIQQSTGNFEIVEKNSVVVSGRVLVADNIEDHETDLPSCDIHEERTEYLEQDEVYRELYLRGYNYSGLFKGIVKCNVDVSAALVKWEDNMTTFLDNLLQLKILQTDTRSLYVPVGIRKLVINPLKHAQLMDKYKDCLYPVYNYAANNVIKSGGFEISGIQAAAISRKKSLATPVLEKHVFVPNHIRTNIEEAVRVITQIILENSLENNFKAVEIMDDYTEANATLLSPLFCKALDDLPSILVNLTVSSKTEMEVPPSIKVENVTLTSTSDFLLVVVSNIFKRPALLTNVLNTLSRSGFILTREKVDFVLNDVENIEVICELVVDDEKLVLCQKPKDERRTVSIEIKSKGFDWLPQLQTALKEDADIIIYSYDSYPEGVLGFVNCMRREPNGNKVRCFFMMDAAPKFDIENPFYQTQFRKQMAVNIYKNGSWGTYRHLLFDCVEEVEGRHFFVQNTVIGDLSSLKWVQGSLKAETHLEQGQVLVFPYYVSLNFKDIMIASGRVSVDMWMDRINQECCQGLEFCGRDITGRRVMGMTDKAGIATMVAATTDFLCEIPDDWTFEDASTVIVVYATVIYGLLKVITIKPGTSILIHSATGGIGLAAINVCLYHGCNIFVTVGTQEKRDYIKKHFPQIPESHIGHSRDESFEEMIKTDTKGRGVDVVLNSLSEEKLRASVRCLAQGGDFIEIGKFDLGNDAAFNLMLLENKCNYHGVMLDRVFAHSPHLKKWILNKIYEGLDTYVKPIPRTVFKQDEVIQAYKYMAAGKHIGKVVIQIRDENVMTPEKEMFRGTPRFNCDPKKSYIIVGGLGGFGLELADWLYLRGAKNVVLVSRLGIQTGYQKQRIKIWRSCGVTVQISTANVTTEEGCLELINQANRLGPVDGIFNLAVVLKDALFVDQNQEAFTTSLAPKAQATIYLDQITRQYCPHLKYFVVFSSVSCGRGNPGQTNYGMANSIMERICEKRKSEGLPGLAIQWGAIGDVGLVAKMQTENKELVIGGTLQQKISSCLEVLDKLLKQDSPIVSSMVVAEKNNKLGDSGSAVDVVAYILGIKDMKTVNHNTSFAELGMDSMMGTEMIQILEKDYEIYFTAKEIRNLTFAKLMDLENQRKKNSVGSSVTEKTTDFFLQYIPREQSSDLPFTEISKHSNYSNEKIVFLFPGIQGVFTGMEPLAKNLKAQILGVNYRNDNTISCIEDYTKKILPHIEETVVKQGTFHIIGYSFGTILAMELVILLEERGYTGDFVLIEGTPGYLLAAARQKLPVDSDKDLQIHILLKMLTLLPTIDEPEQQKEKLSKCENFDELFEAAKSQVPSDLVERECLQKGTFLSMYNHLKFIIDYKFAHKKIKSQVHLFKAKLPMVDGFADDYQLSDLCELPAKITVVDGDHASILSESRLTDGINEILAG